MKIDYDLIVPKDEKVPKLIFIHGAGGDKSQWDLQKNYFQHLGWGVLTLSLPGHGKSNQTKKNTISSYGNDISKLISKLKIGYSTIIGHSMGGAIALYLALNDFKNYIKHLVLIGTGAKLNVSPYLFELLETDFNKALSLLREYGYSRDTEEEIKSTNEEIMKKTGSYVLLEDFKACSAFDVRSELSSINTPTLIICGEKDMMTPLKYSSYLHENIPSSELVVIPNAGHFVFLESPNKVNEVIKEYLIQKG